MNFSFRRYELPDPVGLDFFNSAYEFREHLMNHFLSPTEPWNRTGLRDSALFQRYRTPKARAVCMSAADLKRMYDDVVAVLDRAIEDTAARGGPYVRLRTTRVASDRTRKGPMEALYLVAPEGYVITATDGIVRTAYFPRDCRTDDPLSAMFDRATSYVLQKASAASYHDTKGGDHVYQTDATLYPRDWATLVNPHDLSAVPRARVERHRPAVPNTASTRPTGGV